MDKIFTYAGLTEFYQHTKSISSLNHVSKTDISNGVLLRHDIDFSIEQAYKFSRIEKELDITSTYYVLMSAHYYNPASPDNRKMLDLMQKEGFEIGLHFDPTVYGNCSIDELKLYVDEECQYLEKIIGTHVKSVSLHNPSIHGQYPLFDGYVNAYDPTIFSDENYISDSCMDFRGKNIFKFVEKARESLIQVNLHPIHYSDDSEDYVEIFRKHVLSYIDKIDNNFQVNRTYLACRGNIPLREHMWREKK